PVSDWNAPATLPSGAVPRFKLSATTAMPRASTAGHTDAGVRFHAAGISSSAATTISRAVLARHNIAAARSTPASTPCRNRRSSRRTPPLLAECQDAIDSEGPEGRGHQVRHTGGAHRQGYGITRGEQCHDTCLPRVTAHAARYADARKKKHTKKHPLVQVCRPL